MKKSLVARGITGIVASLLGVAAVGCGAATDQEAAEIGSTEQAITNANITASTALTISSVAKFHEFAAHCKITDASNSKQYLVVASGRSAAGTLSNDVHLFDGTTWTLGGTFTNLDPRVFAVGVTDPAHSDVCVILGGDNDAGTAFDKVVSVKIASGVVTIAQAGKLSAARTKLVALPVDGKIMALGGNTGAAASGVIDMWDSSLMASSTAMPTFKNNAGTAVTLAVPRFDFGAAVATNIDSTKDGIALAGGNDGSGQLSSVEVIKTNGSGVLDNNANTHSTDAVAKNLTVLVGNSARLGGSSAAAPREQLPGFYNVSGAAFVYPGGYDGSGASRVEDDLSVDWSDFSSSSGVTSTATALGTATASPLIVPFSTTRFTLIGGANNDRATGTAIANVQEYNNGTWTNVTTNSSNAALAARLGASGEVLNGSIYEGTGISGTRTGSSPGPTFLNSMDKLF